MSEASTEISQKPLRQKIEEFFVPTDMKITTLERRRVVDLIYTTPIICISLLCFAAGHTFVDETMVGPRVLAILAIASLFIPFTYKITKNTEAASFFIFAPFVFVATWYMVGYGGIVSPQGVTLALLPSAVLYLAGLRGFWVWLFITCAVLVTIFFLSLNGLTISTPYYEYFPHPKKGYLLYDYGMVTVVVIIMYSLIVLLTERARMKAERDLMTAKMRAEDTLAQLQTAQDQLVEQEKMVALGELVVGMSHEVNTPIGNALTAASHLLEETRAIEKEFYGGKLKKVDFENHVELLNETTRIILKNIERASDLITSFKNISVDQSHDDIRRFNLSDYISDVILSLKPTIDRAGHLISVVCPPDIEIENYPGTFSQIFTNFVMNSVVHAFPKGVRGCIMIAVELDGSEGMNITYKDDGVGIPKEHINKIFDPFFTTKRGEGGSGLGLNVVFNLVMHRLGGQLSVDSQPGNGTKFKIHLPKKNLQQEVEEVS